MTEPAFKPAGPAKGQRWRYDGRNRAREFEVVEVIGRFPDTRVRLRELKSTGSRVVDWDRVLLKYVYLGDYSVPDGYSIHAVGAALGGHCFRDPFGFVSGPVQPGQRWTWKQARDAAVAHARAASR